MSIVTMFSGVVFRVIYANDVSIWRGPVYDAEAVEEFRRIYCAPPGGSAEEMSEAEAWMINPDHMRDHMEVNMKRATARAYPALPGIAHALENAGLGNDRDGALAALAMFAGMMLAHAPDPQFAANAYATFVTHAAAEEAARDAKRDPFAL